MFVVFPDPTRPMIDPSDPTIVRLLTDVLDGIRSGIPVTVLPDTISAITAADILGIPYVHVKALVAGGELDAAGDHRVTSASVLAYRERRRDEQRAAFAKLLELEDQLDLGD